MGFRHIVLNSHAGKSLYESALNILTFCEHYYQFLPLSTTNTIISIVAWYPHKILIVSQIIPSWTANITLISPCGIVQDVFLFSIIMVTCICGSMHYGQHTNNITCNYFCERKRDNGKGIYCQIWFLLGY